MGKLSPNAPHEPRGFASLASSYKALSRLFETVSMSACSHTGVSFLDILIVIRGDISVAAFLLSHVDEDVIAWW